MLKLLLINTNNNHCTCRFIVLCSSINNTSWWYLFPGIWLVALMNMVMDSEMLKCLLCGRWVLLHEHGDGFWDAQVPVMWEVCFASWTRWWIPRCSSACYVGGEFCFMNKVMDSKMLKCLLCGRWVLDFYFMNMVMDSKMLKCLLCGRWVLLHEHGDGFWNAQVPVNVTWAVIFTSWTWWWILKCSSAC